ncbi:MAG TPA: hypothetical protein VFY85_14390 [Gemmatimonadaceae bacterium]|nr:hypothetical protein [Gemmatimonadaceae bacterium]
MRLGTSLMLALVVHALPASAQSARPTEPEIAQVVDEVLSQIIPPDSSLSRVRVGDRGVYFDHARTLAAFGHHDTSAAVSRLRLRSTVMSGTPALLEGCVQVVASPCQHLGWGAYAWLGLVSRSDSEMVVRLNVHWADFGNAPFQRGVLPGGRAYLVGFSMEVHLTRAADSSWRFARIGPTRVSD